VQEEEGRDKAPKKILAIIEREQDKAFWRRNKNETGKSKTAS
jgi:hypothetical protein